MTSQPIEVRLTLDHMKHSIVTAFSQYADGLKDQVEESVAAAIRNFDFDAEVQRMAGVIVHETIHAALTNAFRSLQWDDAMRKALVAHMIRELRTDDEVAP